MPDGTDLPLLLPNLSPENHTIINARTPNYNCIAWAYGIDNLWVWPADADSWWPDDVRNEESLEAFAELFAAIGYELCETAAFEDGYEKVAIYADAVGPTHAARQLPSGRWTSKLGSLEDIEHLEPENVQGSAYGRVVLILRRPSAAI